MNRFALGALALLAAAGMASASVVTCPAPPDPGVPVNVVGLTAYCGGLTFSNFRVIPFASNESAAVYLGSINVADKWVSLTFNPGLTSASGSGAQDIHLLYDVSGLTVDGTATAVTGSNATVTSTACKSPVPTSGTQTDLCPDNTLLANLIAFSSPPGPNKNQQTFTGTTKGTGTYVFQDVSVAADSLTEGGGGLSSFTESFRSDEIPEPAAFLLAGPALLGLLALRRKA